MLVDSFDTEQLSTYECGRSSELSGATVRRVWFPHGVTLAVLTLPMQLVNQTLSQSVPASIILAVKSLTKILERARKVQSQWIEVDDETQTSKPKSPRSDNE